MKLSTHFQKVRINLILEKEMNSAQKLVNSGIYIHTGGLALCLLSITIGAASYDLDILQVPLFFS